MTTCPWTFVIKRRQIYFVLMILCLQYFGEDASLSKILKQLKSETFQKEIGGALFKRKGRCWRWNSMLIFRVNKSQSCNLWSLFNVHMFFPLSFYIFLSIGTLSLASHLPNSFQVRDFYVKIFPTVFFVLKAASLGEIDQREETVNF